MSHIITQTITQGLITMIVDTVEDTCSRSTKTVVILTLALIITILDRNEDLVTQLSTIQAPTRLGEVDLDLGDHITKTVTDAVICEISYSKVL